jgi:hypothetical protein
LELTDDIKNIIAEYRRLALQLINPRLDRKSPMEKVAWAAPPM